MKKVSSMFFALALILLSATFAAASEEDIRFDQMMGAVNRLSYTAGPVPTAETPADLGVPGKGAFAQEVKLDPFVDTTFDAQSE